MFKATRFTVLLAGISALILSMGIARYSLTPMLPVMKAQLGIGEALAGRVAGLTYVGYLTGLVIVWLTANLRVKDFFYRYGLVVAVVATAYIGTHEVEIVWYASRFFAGVAGAAGFMLGTGLVLNWLQHNNEKTELGIHFTGVGIGIVVSALAVQMMNPESLTSMNWRLQWLILALIGGFFCVIATMFLPLPKEDEIELTRVELTASKDHLPSKRWLVFMTVAYLCAGMSTTVNVTFTSLIAELRPLEGWGAKTWLIVGLAAIPAPIVWDLIARKINSINALILAFALGVIGNIFLATFSTITTTVIAAIFFGFSFMGIVSLTLSTVGRRYGSRATSVMARLTLIYGLSQIVSPVIAGAIAESTKSFSLPLYLVSGFMVLGVICLLMIRKEHESLRDYQ